MALIENFDGFATIAFGVESINMEWNLRGTHDVPTVSSWKAVVSFRKP